MSINVTVNGNPVSIKRGKMVTYDDYATKKEFDKRRLIRLEQVRQQSKELAEDVRNKVRREKKKHMGQIEREGKEKLKNWQNQKLLELQNQYHEALDDIGMGHKEAQNLENEEEIFNEKKEQSEHLAKERGRVAAAKLQVEKNEANFKKALPVQQKKIVRDIENTRAALVSNIKKYGQPGQQKRNKPVSHTTRDLESENTSEKDIPSTTEETSDTTEYSDKLINYDDPFDSGTKRTYDTGSQFSEEEKNTNRNILCDSTRANQSNSYLKSIEERRKHIDEFRKKSSQVPFDMRISDRIKQRERLASEPDFCDTIGNDQTNHVQETSSEKKQYQDLGSSKCVCPKYHTQCPCIKYSTAVPNKSISVQTENFNEKTQQPSAEIPFKPGIRLKETAKPSTVTSQKVPHYDLANRFQSHIPSTSQVDKVGAESLEPIPNIVSEEEWHNKMKQRDREAQIRGRRALEKELIRRDYEEMMKQLPLLQRKEHIAEIGRDKPEYHMSEERLQELERKKQVRLENAYTKALPSLKPAIVTIPNKIPSNEAFDILEPDDSRTLNLGKWDSDRPKKMFSAEEVREIIKSFTCQKQEDRHSKLKQLLKSLKVQKEQLLNEIRALPKDDSVNALIDDLNSFTDSDEIPKSKSKRKEKSTSERKRRHEDSDSNSSVDNKGDLKTSDRRHGTSPSKKAKKSRRKILILQNTSTQTTPKPVKEKLDLEQAGEKSDPKSTVVCREMHTPCDCNKENAPSSEELCQILIKLHNDDDPKVEVVQSDKVPKKVETKSVATETEVFKKPLAKPQKKILKKPEIKDTKPKSSSKSESWKEQLSKNSISTSSTSYVSPPDFSRRNITSSTDLSIDSFYHLRRKPQQKNIPARSVDPVLINYIRKLLSKSKLSVDELGVSSSDVETPSQSVIEMESNNPLAPLHDIIKYINLKSGGSGVPPNSVITPEGSEFRDGNQISEKDTTGSSKKSKDSILCQYTDVTDSCSKRIANLDAMIEKIRRERISMHHSPPTLPEPEKITSPNKNDKDHSTAYLDLPQLSDRSKETSRSSSISVDNDDFKQKLLEVDRSLAEKLNMFPSTKSESEGPIDKPPTPPIEDTSDQTGQDFLDRLRRLVDNSQKQNSKSENGGQQSFVPLLLDIPKLPIFEPHLDYPTGESTRNHRHPPPSKGLTIAKKFNGNISLVPHELSTIAEADSQLSTKASPNASKSLVVDEKSISSPKSEEPSPLPLVPPESEKSRSKSTEDSDKQSSKHKSKSLSSSDSSSEMSCLEDMLRSINMEWAIPVLHKTQEALALTSSSSSIETSSRRRKGKMSSDSEVSLKDFLQKQVFSKISSSSLKSDASPSPSSFLKDLSDISAIQHSSSAEYIRKKTSTPLESVKSKESGKGQYFGERVEAASTVKGSSSSESGKQVFQSLTDDPSSTLGNSL